MTQEEKRNRNNKDYTKGKIYIIRNSENDLTYIGSTCQTLAQRMAQHRRDMKYPKRQQYKLYQAMNELGVDAFYIELLEDYPCQKKEELLKKEGEKIRELNSELNKIISGRNKQEYYQNNRDEIKDRQKHRYEGNKPHYLEYAKAYRDNNKDVLKDKKCKYYEDNKERILEKKKEYRRNNKHQISEKRRQYYQENKELITEKKRQYREKNKELIAQRKRQYYQKNKDKLAERRRQLQNEEKKQTATE